MKEERLRAGQSGERGRSKVFLKRGDIEKTIKKRGTPA